MSALIEEQKVPAPSPIKVAVARRPIRRPASPEKKSSPVTYRTLLETSQHSILGVERFSKFADDTLFFAFYQQQGAPEQLLAANELARRGWRFVSERFVWVRAVHGKSEYFDYEDGWEVRPWTE